MAQRKRRARTSTPSRWYQKAGTWYYDVPVDLREQWDGRRWFRLGRTLNEAYETWFRRGGGGGDLRTVGDLFDRYLGEVVPALAAPTQRQYTDAIGLLRVAFGHMAARSIRPIHAYQYLDRRPRVAGNREIAVFSSVLSRAVRWGAIEMNPLKGQVRRNQERPRDRYITDDELAHFQTFCNPMLRRYLRLKLLTGLRQGQLLDLQWRYWRSETLTVPGTKGGRDVQYSGQELTDLMDELLLEGGIHYVFEPRQELGVRYTGDGFRSIWNRAMRKYAADGGERFTEHDVRAKVASDSESGDAAQARLGHRSRQITERVYQRGPVQVAVLTSAPEKG